MPRVTNEVPEEAGEDATATSPLMSTSDRAQIKKTLQGLSDGDAGFVFHVTSESHVDKVKGSCLLMEERLTRLRFEQVFMEFDGNCQFRSMAHQLFGNAEEHDMIRYCCVEYLRANSDEFSIFFDGEEWQRYLTTMATDGTWGDELTLKAACNVFGCSVHVLTSEN